jgi:ribosomal protein S18 acetylase RimI-like enzyme
VSETTVVVRDIHEGDQEPWRRLFAEYGVFYKTDFAEIVLDGVWSWLMDAEADLCAVVAVDDGLAYGFAHYRQLPDAFTAGPGWFIDNLYVEPGHRGSGAGAALIDAVAERAASDGGGTLRWMTAGDNTAAQSVYDKLGTRTNLITYQRQI